MSENPGKMFVVWSLTPRRGRQTPFAPTASIKEFFPSENVASEHGLTECQSSVIVEWSQMTATYQGHTQMTAILTIALAIVIAYDVYMLITYRHQITCNRNGGLHFWTFGLLGGSVYLARKSGKLGVRKVGGLHHWRMGRIGGAVYVKAYLAPPSRTRIAFALNI